MLKSEIAPKLLPFLTTTKSLTKKLENLSKKPLIVKVLSQKSRLLTLTEKKNVSITAASPNFGMGKKGAAIWGQSTQSNAWASNFQSKRMDRSNQPISLQQSTRQKQTSQTPKKHSYWLYFI